MFLYYALIFILGMVVGSFFNVLIHRLGREDGIWLGRSKCPHCEHKLTAKDLIPLVSFLLLAGKCRYCRKKISIFYPLVELVFGLTFLLLIINQPPILTPALILKIALLFGFLGLLFFDLKHYILPDKIILPLVVVVLFYNWFYTTGLFTNMLTTGLSLGLIFAMMNIVSRGEWMGLGDAKLVILIGLVFGFPLGILAVFLSIWSAALVGIALLISRKAGMKTALPFGTFLSAISIIFLIFEYEISLFYKLF